MTDKVITSTGDRRLSVPSRPPLLDVLRVERGDDDALYSVANEANPAGSLFGGALIGQLMAAASAGVAAPALPHHVQLSFVAAGRPDLPMRYVVRELFDGRSFSMRQVTGTQGDRVVVNGQVSFHVPELGPTFEQPPAQPLAPPETHRTLQEIVKLRNEKFGTTTERLSRMDNVEMRLPDGGDMLVEKSSNARLSYWIRSRNPLPDDPILQACALGYLSDYWFPVTALSPHLEVKVNHGLRIVSLNHAIWFHQPVTADDWLYVEAHSPASANARGVSIGGVYNRSGQRVATLAQENLFRGWVEQDGEVLAPRDIRREVAERSTTHTQVQPQQQH
jgi:acyl-CoA thioesterase II